HLGRADHLPAARMMLTAPEFVIAELVKMLDQVQVAAELQQRVLADRMMRREERPEVKTRHGMPPANEVYEWARRPRRCADRARRPCQELSTPLGLPGCHAPQSPVGRCRIRQ